MKDADLTQFDAAAANKLVKDAYSLTGEYMRQETLKILEQIKTAATKGLSNMTVSCTDGVVEARLRALGFHTKVTYDQRDGDFMLVNW